MKKGVASAIAAASLARLASATNNTTIVTSEALQKLITIEDLLAGSQKLQDFADANDGHRAFGSGGHNATVDWLYDSLNSLGYYDVVKQPFTEIYSAGTATLSVTGEEYEVGIMTYTPPGEVSGSIVKVANLGCVAADYPPEVAGKIALIQRGECTFGAKSVAAAAAGAGAALIYNNVAGSLAGTLGAPFLDYAPTVGISLEDGEKIVAALDAGEVTADLVVDSTVEERVNFNVIAETKTGDHDNVLVLGGHSDSVAAGPGIK
jgi:Zn-dependent M28 family amino/carboxypeptidase